MFLKLYRRSPTTQEDSNTGKKTLTKKSEELLKTVTTLFKKIKNIYAVYKITVNFRKRLILISNGQNKTQLMFITDPHGTWTGRRRTVRRKTVDRQKIC